VFILSLSLYLLLGGFYLIFLHRLPFFCFFFACFIEFVLFHHVFYWRTGACTQSANAHLSFAEQCSAYTVANVDGGFYILHIFLFSKLLLCFLFHSVNDLY